MQHTFNPFDVAEVLRRRMPEACSLSGPSERLPEGAMLPTDQAGDDQDTAEAALATLFAIGCQLETDALEGRGVDLVDLAREIQRAAYKGQKAESRGQRHPLRVVRSSDLGVAIESIPTAAVVRILPQQGPTEQDLAETPSAQVFA